MFMKSFNAPRLKCGIDSATMLISKFGCLDALLINTGMIPKVLPALVPP